MSISSIFNELDIIRDEVKDWTASGALSSKEIASLTDAHNYVSEASILLAERKIMKEKQSAGIVLPARKPIPSSSSLEHIGNTTVDAPTYWKSSSSGKKKSKAFKAVPTITKKNKAKQSKAENYASRLETKHMKGEVKMKKKAR
jgi:hypothetical protein